tara:strand:+ start:1609 stop:3357 length:1749 start_codon:yes stop_codon:yes gene_type:complete
VDIIKILPKHVSNQIAAGEVIQRPASAVKEMLENSLDAGSTEIKLIIKNAGKKLIQVVDNGCGMSKSDVKKCFIRHATSKIENAQDLFNITTMGFRGEAMSSIAAIAQVEINTKLTNQETGTYLRNEGGKIYELKESSTTNGTSIKVKNIFYNVPARRNFLKSENVEMRHITEEFTKIALANPNIKMQLFHDSKELFHLPISNFKKRIINLFGNKKNESLVPVSEETSIIELSGFIGKPETAKKTRGEQYFFVNGRYIKHHYLQHAVVKAFEDLIPIKYYPSHFINLKINPKLIDINIHPTKNEIKFEDEKAIYAIIRATIKRSLGIFNIAPSLDFSKENAFELDFKNIENTNFKQPTIKIDKTYNPFDHKKNNDQNKIQNKLDVNTNPLFDDINLSENLNVPFQIGNQFITISFKDGIKIIHQRRAHKRILFEYYSKSLKHKNGKSQKLLFPKSIELNLKEINLVENLKKELESLGFIFKLKKQNMEISAIPNECREENIQEILEEILHQAENDIDIEINQTQKIAKSLANSLAISNSKPLKTEEMNSLYNELLKCKVSNICPSGKSIIKNFKIEDLKKYF